MLYSRLGERDERDERMKKQKGVKIRREQKPEPIRHRPPEKVTFLLAEVVLTKLPAYQIEKRRALS